MKLFMTLCLLALAFNFTEAGYSCYTGCGAATQDIEAFFLGDNDFKSTVIESFTENNYTFEEYSIFEEEVQEMLESDGLVHLNYSSEFKETFTNISENTWNKSTNTQTGHGNSYSKRTGSKYTETRETTHNKSTNNSTSLSAGRFPNRENSNESCNSQCMDALSQIYQAHLQITEQLFEQYKQLFQQVNSPSECRDNRDQYQELYNKICELYPTPVRQSLIDYVDNKIAKSFCRRGNMWNR